MKPPRPTQSRRKSQGSFYLKQRIRDSFVEEGAAMLMNFEELKSYIIDEISIMDEFSKFERRKTLLDVFSLLIQEKGISYSRVRAAWIRHHSKQLRLFPDLK